MPKEYTIAQHKEYLNDLIHSAQECELQIQVDISSFELLKKQISIYQQKIRQAESEGKTQFSLFT
jgi:hypothetical protein